MLTIFSIPKPFEGETALLQTNALRSWRTLGDDVEILLLGDEAGVADAAATIDARHVAHIARTELGTPLVSAAFEAAAKVAQSPILCYANADIIFLSDLLPAVRRVGERGFLLVGRRLNVKLDEELETAAPGWEAHLRRTVLPRGSLGNEYAIDWFAFPRQVEWRMPPFAVGRPVWDNWVLWRARDLGLRVVDATGVVTAVHQEHGYAHVPQASGLAWEGPEADRNREVMGSMRHRYNLLDATHVLTPRGVRPALRSAHLKRRVIRAGVDHPRFGRLLGRAIAGRRALLRRKSVRS